MYKGKTEFHFFHTLLHKYLEMQSFKMAQSINIINGIHVMVNNLVNIVET